MANLTTQTDVLISGTAAVTASLSSRIQGALFLLSVTSAASIAGDKLDVFLQHNYDGGTGWDDFVRFTQVLGNGGAVKYLATWLRDVVPTTVQGAANDGAMAAGVNQGPKAGTWRVKWIITNGGGDHKFTFTVSAMPVMR